MLQAAKTDLAIRTGKATVHLEEAAAQDVRRQQAEEEARRKAEAEVQIQSILFSFYYFLIYICSVYIILIL